MTVNHPVHWGKIFLPAITLIMAIFCWPRGVMLFFGYSYWDPIFFGWRTFFFFIFLISLILLRPFKLYSLPVKSLIVLIILCMFIEWHLLYINLPAMHTFFCMVPPPSTYDPWRIAILVALIGAGSLSFTLIHPKFRDEILDFPVNKLSVQNDNMKMNYFLHQITSTPLILGLFHSTFFMYIITGTIGCNGIPIHLLGLISLPWMIAASFVFIPQFRKNFLFSSLYLVFFVFLSGLALFLNINIFLQINLHTIFDYKSIDAIVLSLNVFFSVVPIFIWFKHKSSLH